MGQCIRERVKARCNIVYTVVPKQCITLSACETEHSFDNVMNYTGGYFAGSSEFDVN